MTPVMTIMTLVMAIIMLVMTIVTPSRRGYYESWQIFGVYTF
jgi:hypothetical protein